jgi:hypothetical protein
LFGVTLTIFQASPDPAHNASECMHIGCGKTPKGRVEMRQKSHQ